VSASVSTVVPCASYDSAEVEKALRKALCAIDGLSWLRPGMTVAIKPNLVMRKKPEGAATTHPVMLAELTKLLVSQGASVIIGDSPGGLYTPAALRAFYSECGLKLAQDAGAQLNYDCSQREVLFPEARVAKRFAYTAWLDQADAVITFAKLKTHGMMGISGAVKNQFGVVPGTIKPEYHFLYPKTEDFADMLVDLNEYVKPKLALIDGVWGMEGNGPTAGDPRFVGALIASTSVYEADLCLSALIGSPWNQAPTVQAAVRRGLSGKELTDERLLEEVASLKVRDYKRIPTKGNVWAREEGIWRLIGPLLRRKPILKHPQKCISCGECARVCPAHAITMQKTPVFDYQKCIRCFCCQEFCPKAALSVHRSVIARILNR